MKVLTIDVGTGTSDILLWDSEAEGENQTHIVAPSATRVVAREIAEAAQRGMDVVFVGPTMGGGPCMRAMARHVAQGYSFYATPSAGRSFDDDLDKVRGMGVSIVDADEAAVRVGRGAIFVRSGDVRFDELLQALSLIGETEPLDGCAVAVQDHGRASPGESDRLFRFAKLAESLTLSDRLENFFYQRDQIPECFTRMTAVAGLVGPEFDLVVGDTGPSALWGAALAASDQPCLAINFGNGHTIMALVDTDRIYGLFEHHTSALDPAKMETYIRRFAAGDLESAEVFADGGHGTIPVLQPFDLDNVEIIVTGPRRSRFAGMGLAQIEASLYGDMMLTGCYGLLQGYLARREA